MTQKGYLKENHKFDIVACRELSSGMGNNAQIPPRAHLRSSANAPRGAVKSARKKKRRKLLEQGAIFLGQIPCRLLYSSVWERTFRWKSLICDILQRFRIAI